MAAKPKEYQRLPGSGRRNQGWVAVASINSRLWLAQDHLLAVDSLRFSEDYKRFYFRDIQAIIIRRTETGKYTNLVLFSLALPALIGVLMSSGVWAITWSIFAGIFLAILLLNTLAGPTSVCHLRTAVQTEELPSLRRLRRALKVAARLRPLIAAAQGELVPEEIPARMAQLANPQVAASHSNIASEPPTFANAPENTLPPPSDASPVG